MFIVERMVSLFTYAAVLVITCFFVSRCLRSQVKAVLFVYLLMLMIFAFYYKPYRTADLYRLREYIQYWIDLPPNRLIRYALNSNAPSWVVFAYLVSKMGNINWLQTMSCLISFSCSLYIIGSTISKNNIRGKDRALLLFSYMAIGTIFLEAISGIRTIMGFTIVAFCLYREIEEDKSFWIHLPLYFIAGLLHPSVIVLVIARIVSAAFTEKGWRNILITAVFLIPLVLFIYRQGNQYIFSAFTKAKSYLSGSEYTYKWEILIGFLELFQTFIILRHFKKCFDTDKRRNYLWLFSLVLQIVSLISLPFSYAVFRRYTLFCTMITIPFFGKILSPDLSDLKDTVRFKQWMWLLSYGVFVISFIRGDICGYKFFVR